MAKTKRVADALLSGVKTPAQMKAEMAVDRARGVMPKAERDAKFIVPSEPGSSPVKEGYVRLYHQTSGDNLRSIESQGLLLDHAKGIEGPRGVYAGETPFYGDATSRPTLEFQVPVDQWQQPFVLRDVMPDDFIATHFPWHRHARYLEENNLVPNVLAGKYDNLSEDGDTFKAVQYIKEKYANEPDINKAQGGIIKMGKGGVGRKVGNLLPKAERDANLGNMLRKSAVKEPMYHASKADVSTFSPEYRTELSSMGHHFGTADQANFRTDQYDFSGDNVNIGKYYLDIKNPLETSHMGSFAPDHLAEQMMDLGILDPNKYDALSSKLNYESVPIGTELVKILKKNGYDGLRYANEREGEGFSYVPFESTQIKSAIGNQGTYDTTNPDITKAKGGAVHMAGGGAGRKLANKMLPKVEAPSIMTRSDISELADYIKNREGSYGERRVQRAADEISRLGELYTQEALRSAFSGDNARALMTLKPADFEKFATPLDPYFLTSKAYRSRDDAGGKMAHEDYIRHLEDIQARGGFKDVPFFEINKEEQGLPLLPFISGHEGRHRSRAMTAAGENAGLVQLLPRSELREPFPRRSQEDYIEALKREMAITGNKILPQTYTGTNPKSFDDTVIRRPAIDLPDFYANGGAVKMSEGGEPDQAEIDRMRLEMSNSPVIQATPQTPIQRAIGTLGGYMDRAGQFVSESIEPLAEKHPIKHFLGELLLADSLKSAGTAMQDYTKTSRDITEDQPYVRAPLTGSGQTLKLDPRMLDVMGIAQPVASATTRLVGAGAKKAAPFAKDVAEMASELYMKGEIPGMIPPNMYAVSPEVKPSKVLAPANEMGFYSATEAAALNLPRKSGSGQAFLNDLLKQENVRPDEINAMGLDTFLKGKNDVTAAEVQDYIASNKIQLGEARYGSLSEPKLASERDRIAMKLYNYPYSELPDYRQVAVDKNVQINPTQFSKWQLPGGENYREVVITLPQNKVAVFPKQAELEALESRLAQLKAEGNREEYGRLIGAQTDLRNERTKFLQTEQYRLDQESNKNRYQSPHFDEPNAIAHLRMSDRVTDGKKTLLVDEVQSDWHQEGREKGYKNDIDMPAMSADELLLDYGDKLSSGQKDYLKDFLSRWERAEQGTNENIRGQRLDNLSTEYESWAKRQKIAGVPDAPFKDDWYQLALKRAVKEAIDGGYDRVALPTGSRVAERFDLSKQIDRIDYNKNDDGTYSMSAIKGGKEVFSKERLDENELSGLVGKDVAKKIVGDEGKAQYDADIADELGVGVVKSLTGLDLSVGGKGMKKYYDEIYPGYLKKFGKKYGANVGMTSVQTEPSTDRIFRDGGKYYAYTGQGRDTKEFNTYAQALKFLGIGAEPLHYMEITPAMREAFKTGIHMKRGGKVQFANNIDAMRLALSKG
jgi:hypothetical protein